MQTACSLKISSSRYRMNLAGGELLPDMVRRDAIAKKRVAPNGFNGGNPGFASDAAHNERGLNSQRVTLFCTLAAVK
jgi:hypothetical protein